MYISSVSIKGYKNSKIESSIEFSKGLNVLIGENASGKSTIIDALRLTLKETEMSYKRIDEDDFYKSFQTKESADAINIDVLFKGLEDDEKITFLTWCDGDFNAHLHLDINSKTNAKGYYKKSIWGGKSRASMFEEETFDCIDCVYLPPLRDAEAKLVNGRRSRLAVLLSQQYKNDEAKERLVQNVDLFNEKIVSNADNEFSEINKAKQDINETLKRSMGSVFGQSVNLQFADASFSSILQSIKMVFFPNLGETDATRFKDIALNSLGYNNLLYIATVFAELELIIKQPDVFKVLLIEEPEAHLHPQIQVKLVKYLEELPEKNKNLQIIVSTHSPVLASSVSLDSIIHVSSNGEKILSRQLSKYDYEGSKNFINRWLDVTKSTLLFSKGVILVEGVCESILVPELAKYVLKEYNAMHQDKKLPATLEEAGVSVININGINFKHFMKLFCDVNGENTESRLPFRCSGMTDNDPAKEKVVKRDENYNELKDKDGEAAYSMVEVYPDSDTMIPGANEALKLKDNISKSNNTRLYSSPYKTFEYDLAMEGNTLIMAKVLYELWPNHGKVKATLKKIYEGTRSNLKEDSIYIFERINRDEVGKAVFSQVLSQKLADKLDEQSSYEFKVPKYTRSAVIWACGGEVDV